MNPEHRKGPFNYGAIGVWLAIGAGMGTAIGAATGQMGVWIGVGAGVGTALGAALTLKR